MKTVFITGGSKGIGKSIVELFENQSFRVIAPSHVEFDLSSTPSIEAFFAQYPDLQCDILINNAGINPIHELLDFDEDEWLRVLNTNLYSAFRLTRRLVPGMQKKGWGRIVNMSSCYSAISRSGRSAYSASKSGLNGFTRAVAIEMAASNILVNAVCPGFVATELTFKNNTADQLQKLCGQIPLGRLANPAEIAEFVFFLCSEKNSYITGQSLLIDGGLTIV